MIKFYKQAAFLALFILTASFGYSQGFEALRLKVNPIITPGMLPSGDGDNINGPSMIKVPDWIQSPLGKYYLYFAHHQGKYIRLAYADHPEGPWKIYEKGTLKREDCIFDDGINKLAVKHIASPDLLIDPEKKELVMYFHISAGKTADGVETPQVTLRATSKNGIDFLPEHEILGESYFRVFKWDNQFYAMSKKGLYRSDDGKTKFEQGPNPYRLVNDPNGSYHLRHLALLQKGEFMYIFYSRIGDAPEHILYSKIHLTKDWQNWEASTPVSLLEPQYDYEGVNNPIVKSVEGASKKSVRELRDPAIFEDQGKIYLLYSIAGELGIGIAEVKINQTGSKTNGISVSDSIVRQVEAMEKEGIIQRAQKLLNVKPRTVTATSCPRSAGGRHDFYSEGPYWWPDPANPNGKFIRHDGLRFPGWFQDHDKDLRNFSWIVGTETSAWLLTGNQKYANAAMEHLMAWLVDTTTMMNPNMLYAQAIRGVNTGRGTGIIDAGQLMDVAQSVMILQKSPAVSAKDIAAIKEWFGKFVSWLTTHSYGLDEMNARNNHGTWWHAQVASYARLTGDEKVLRMCRDHYMKILLPNQMASNGSYPEELARTKPYSYSLFNLDATASLLWILDDKNFNDWNYVLPDGRGIWKGLDYMLPFLLDKKKWTGGEDVDHWNDQPEARQFMIFAAIAGSNPAWIDLWKSLKEKNNSDESAISMMLKNPLLWINIKNNK